MCSTKPEYKHLRMRRPASRWTALAEAVANGEMIKTEIMGGEATGQVLVITAVPGSAEATAQPENNAPAKKLRRGAAPADSADK